jgi:3-hydroxybutyryl-CoA dehydrogenase
MLVDFAMDAVGRGVADAEDVDTAMRLGVNYPLGPVEWGRRLTTYRVAGSLELLHEEYPTGRYAPSQALRRQAVREEHS